MRGVAIEPSRLISTQMSGFWSGSLARFWLCQRSWTFASTWRRYQACGKSVTSSVSEPAPVAEPVAWPSAVACWGREADSPTARARRAAGAWGISFSPLLWTARGGRAGSAGLAASRTDCGDGRDKIDHLHPGARPRRTPDGQGHEDGDDHRVGRERYQDGRRGQGRPIGGRRPPPAGASEGRSHRQGHAHRAHDLGAGSVTMPSFSMPERRTLSMVSITKPYWSAWSAL